MFDYFRAPDDDSVLRVMEQTDGGPVPGTVDTKFIDPTVVLGKLIALVRGEPWSTGTVDANAIWPDPATVPKTPDAWDDPDSPWATGPWVEVLDDRTRDTLADLDGSRNAELAAEWARIEEFRGRSDAGYLTSLIGDLSELARAARAAGQHLYCWECL